MTEVEGLPPAFAEAQAEVTADRGAQVHSSGRGTIGKEGAVFHGQGGLPDAEKSELQQYLRHVASAVEEHIHDQEGDLILAGVDYVTSLYKHVSQSPRRIEATISGNVDHLPPSELHEKALALLAHEIDRRRQGVADQFRDPTRTGIATDPEQVLCAAFDGRIDTLIVDDSAELFGSFYPDTKAMHETKRRPTGDPADPSHDLIEMAVVQTLRHRGSVLAFKPIDMPVRSPIAASLRY
jgi:hypothetical protein